MEICKTFYYRILDGDNLSKICQQFNTCQENILRNNAEIPIYAGEWVKIKVNDYLTHFVRPTETLTTIAKTYSTTTENLIEENNLQSEKVFIGQKIKIKLNPPSN